MDASIVCLSFLLTVAPAPHSAGHSDGQDAPPPPSGRGVVSQGAAGELPYELASSFRDLIIRGQSRESPFYQRPPATGGSAAGAGDPFQPAGDGYPAPVTPVQRAAPGQPAPASPSPFLAPRAPRSPVTPNGPFGAPAPAAPRTAPFSRFGVNGPQPYDIGASLRLDTGYITSADTSAGYGEVDVFELDFALPYVTPAGDGNMWTFTPQYNMRLFNGPASPPGRPGFPNDLYRFGFDFQYDFLVTNSVWSGELGFNPSINTDFEKSLTSKAINWDGRAIAYLRAAPRFTLALGVLYWDRVDDVILPYAGFIWLPSDRWELRIIFPEPRISYFAGHVWGKPTWIYVRGKYDVEAYEVETPPGNQTQVQLEDWRIMVGARKEQSWGGSFLEAGWVFGRDVEYAGGAPDLQFGDAFTVRGGLRY